MKLRRRPQNRKCTGRKNNGWQREQREQREQQSSKAANSVFGRESPLKVETRYIEGRGWTRGRYDDTVLQAIDRGNGNVELVYATADSRTKLAKTNKTNYVTYTLDHGFVNDEPHNINFDNIKSFTGKTYDVKSELKRRGYKYRNGAWVKA